MEKSELEINNERFNYVGFKLLSLELRDFEPFIKESNIRYSFCDDKNDKKNIYNTVIIGPNGTRKSRLFNLIVYIFKTIEELKKNKAVNYDDNKIGHYGIYSKGNYTLKYILNNEIYEIQRNQTGHGSYGYSFFMNYERAYNWEEIELPLNIIGNSINITDKFPQYKKGEFDRFEYLGIKYNPQAASTKAYIKKTFDFVTKLSSSEAFDKFLTGINLITKTFSGEQNEIQFTYHTVNAKRFFNGNLKYTDLETYFEDMRLRYEKTGKKAPFMLGRFTNLRDENLNLLEEAINFCNELSEQSRLLPFKKSSPTKLLKFNLADKNDLEILSKKGKLISTLYNLQFLRNLNIEIVPKDGSAYSLENSSSGEHNLITSLIGLLATIKPHGLLLIDEPEISLHPNWQMRYLSFFNELFQGEAYSSCHAIFATHSHFLISDLKNENSTIIGLKGGEKGVEIIDLPNGINTYGLSVEDILWNVFQVPTTRNYYLANMVGDILKTLSKLNKSAEEIKALKGKKMELIQINNKLKEIDPLKKVLDIVLEKI